MISYIFLIGRPGSGKSVVYRLMETELAKKKITCSRVDDFLTLKEIVDADTEFKKHVKKDGGFAITDWSVLDEALSKLNGKLKELKKPNHIIFIEFARDNYEKAMKNFEKDLLLESLIFYTYCPYEECYRRNIERFKKAQKSGHDDHIVPMQLMETYYRHDDFENAYLENPDKLKKMAEAEIIVIDSNVPGSKDPLPQIEKIAANKF